MGSLVNKKTTLADVANELGVSKTTVSRVISGKGRISEETKQRVFEYIEKSGYKPNVIAKGLAKSRTYNIAMILPADCNIAELPFFQACTCGVCEAAAARDYDVLVVYRNGEARGTLERIIDNHKIDGVLLGRTLVKDETVDYVMSKKIPIVAIGSSEKENLIQVDNDHLSACRELTKALLAQGRKKIALVGGNMQHVVTRTRYQGFAEAFREADLPLLADLIYMNTEREEQIKDIVDDLLQKKADCVVCMDDMLCSRVMEFLEKKGIRIPEDIHIASFYSSLLISGRTQDISSLQFDATKLGKTACDALLDLIDGVEVAQRRLLEYTFTDIISTK